jgi:pimeloyl-ACP methyl ester carboxylesterase
LNTLLRAVGAPPDRIVIGHSYGGLMAVLHAHLFPERVRGLVLVDAMNPRFVKSTGDFIYSTVPKIERPVTAKDTALVRLVNTFAGALADPNASDVDLAIPVVVITAGEPWLGKPEIDQAWRRSHEAIAAEGARRRLVVADGSKHDIPAKRPDTIIDAALSLIASLPGGARSQH